ncbi:hypothetical protein HYV84_06435 [Candidatus Woesearchaeota archaeon]|nr:hypothetical protein [Candidatus Woesearchaeota archaeon]
MVRFQQKGQGMSLNTIIIAAIVLIVLVVLWSIFTGRMGSFAGELQKCKSNDCTSKAACEAAGGVEDPDGTPACQKAQPTPGGGVVVPLGQQVCCIKFPGLAP